MRFNLYVPQHRQALLTELEALSADTGKPKNELVLEALEQYVQRCKEQRRLQLERFSMGDMKVSLDRRSVYEEILDGHPEPPHG